MDWEKTTDDLYKKIKPIGGDLISRIESNFISRQKINSIWIEFDMNEFIYEDPFYGEQKSTAVFRMNVEPFSGERSIDLTHIQELKNKVIKSPRTQKKGAFSNSLDFTAPLIKFGKIKDHTIEFEMEYCLTNSSSYGMMTGTIDDHIKASGTIKVDLKINDMLILTAKNKGVERVLKSMNPDIYDLKSAQLATNTNNSFADYDQYRVPYKNLNVDLNRIRKPWWKIRLN
ncbi:MAG: hypothetical protein DWQ02_02880 [Bacteroidetes bacterium]|nr:MAG: hypothetical protein DWQ02_02880 [Bacteroidota bacterium]